jgi:hypothetical protein
VELSSIQGELQSELKVLKRDLKAAPRDRDSKDEIDTLKKQQFHKERERGVAQLDIYIYEEAKKALNLDAGKETGGHSAGNGFATHRHAK